MSFHPERMKQLIEQDRFLLSAFKDIQEHLKNEHEALLFIYNVYVQQEPILLNAYHLLTD